MSPQIAFWSLWFVLIMLIAGAFGLVWALIPTVIGLILAGIAVAA